MRLRAASSRRTRSRIRACSADASDRRPPGTACRNCSTRNARDVGPVLLGARRGRALVQVDPHAEPRLVDLEEAAQPRAEERAPSRDRCSRTAPRHRVFAPSPAYSAIPAARNASSLSVPMRSHALASHAAIWRELRFVERVRAALWAGPALGRGERRRRGPTARPMTWRRRARWRCPAGSCCGRAARVLAPAPRPSRGSPCGGRYGGGVTANRRRRGVGRGSGSPRSGGPARTVGTRARRAPVSSSRGSRSAPWAPRRRAAGRRPSAPRRSA